MATNADMDEPVRESRGAARRRALFASHGAVLAVIALGGGLGALARYGASVWFPTAWGQFPWATFATNVLGCFAIGVFMVLCTEVLSVHRLLRPFVGVGVLGGFTTFSTYAVEIGDLSRGGSGLVAFGYLAGTLVCALLAVFVGVLGTRWATEAIRGADG